MAENDLQDLELEDILKEFGQTQPEEEEQEAAPVSEEVPEEAPVSADTIRLDKIQKAVTQSVSADTVVFEAPEPEADAVVYEPKRKQAEPFTESWEPDYAEPEYAAPIVFKPKGRLQQLRAKLVAGPEKRYYELSEQGFGKLQAGIFLSFLIFAVAAGSTVLYALGLVSPERQRLLVFIQLLCMLLCALLGCYRMLDGIGDIFKLRFSLNTWLVLTFVVCCIDGVLCLQSQRISCGALFCLEALMAQIGEYYRRQTEIRQMDTLRKASELEAVVRTEDYHDGKPGFVTVPGEPESFMDTYDKPSLPEKILQFYALGSFALSLGFGIWAGVRGGFGAGVQTMAGALLLSMPATAFLTHSRPRQLLQKRLHKLGTVLGGWQGVKNVPRKAVFPITSRDLVPNGLLKLNGVKFFGEMEPDRVVTYAASLAAADGGCLEPILRQQLAGRNGHVLITEDLHSYPGGVTGVVDGYPVALGTAEFMQQVDVKLPQEAQVPQAVYMSINGILSGVFAITFQRSKNAGAGIRTLCSYRGLTPLVAQPDCMITAPFLAQRFGAYTGRVVLPPESVRRELAEKKPEADAPVIALCTKEGLAQRAFAVTGSRMLKLTLITGTVIHLLGGVLGLVAAGLLTWAGAADLLTPVSLLIYGLLWMVPGFLVTQWTRIL